MLLLISSCSKSEKLPDPVTDIEGNIYKTIRIGEQVWMAENLRTSTFNDGTEIPLITDETIWGNLSTPGYSWYNNDESAYKEPFGALYNGYAVNTGTLCPTGWHVPEREEWQELREFLGDTIYGGGKLKEAGTFNWHAPNEGADNSSGFTALPAGIRYFEGSFSSLLYFTSFWSVSKRGNDGRWYLSLYFDDAIALLTHRSEKHGFSVRCLKD
jgi:uncharacterized protein (TIGR02145 family)